MTTRTKHPGSALQRATGAEGNIQMDENSHAQTYATSGELQRSYVMRRCGVGRRQAAVIAGLIFGEGRR